MQTVILCGGLGTRLGAFAAGLPKSLVPVAGRPFIEWQLELLRNAGLCRALLCVGHKAAMIQAHLGDGSRFNMKLLYSIEPEQGLLGTGGALLQAMPMLESAFFVLYGDSFLPTDYRPIIDAFTASSLPAMMSVFRNQGRWDASNVCASNGLVTHYSKATRPGEADFIDYGLTALKREALQPYIGKQPPFDLGLVYADLVAAAKMAAFEVTERFYEIGSPESLGELDAMLRARRIGGTKQ